MNNLEKVEVLKGKVLRIGMVWYMTKVSVVEVYRSFGIGRVTSQRTAIFMWMFFLQIHVQRNNDVWRNCPPARIVSALVDTIQSGTWLPTIRCNVIPIIFSVLVVPTYQTITRYRDPKDAEMNLHSRQNRDSLLLLYRRKRYASDSPAPRTPRRCRSIRRYHQFLCQCS